MQQRDEQTPMGNEGTQPPLRAGMLAIEDMLKSSIAELRVSNGTPSKALATSILRYLDDGKRVTLSCIGAQCLNQAVKAVAIANAEAASGGHMLVVIPSFETRSFPDRNTGEPLEMTGMSLFVGRVPLVI